MAKNVNLDKAKLVVVTGAGVELNLEVDEQNRVVIRMESQEGGHRIMVGKHEEDPKAIVCYLDDVPPPQEEYKGPRLVK
jgi:rRNA processing protein Krr1/Pno1